MATPANAIPGTGKIAGIGQSFWRLIRKDLTPYPGRVWVVGRVTIAATIVMLLVMTFRLPGGFLGAIFTVFLTRENPMATFQAGFRTVAAFLIATGYTIVTAAMLINDPFTHFLWVIVSLFIAFYLISILEDYGTAVAFGFMIAGAIPIWDENVLNVNDRLENTLWITFSVAIGVAVTIVVEYVFRRVHPTTDLAEGVDGRFEVVEDILRSAAAGQPVDSRMEARLQLYTWVGVSRLRRLILRSEYSSQFKTQASAAVSLVGRLIDVAESFKLMLAERENKIEPPDAERCTRLADQIVGLRKALLLRRLPEDIRIPPHTEPSFLNFFSEMERTVSFIPKTFTGTGTVESYVPTPLGEIPRERIFVHDALTNPVHLQFALRGTLAAMVCYVVYSAIDWRGLSTSLATCFITALSTIGSSRQKQILRLGGAILGGVVFGMGAQVFILPYLDSIAGFTVLFALVTAISAWISTASARLSYLGVQLALAYYLINLQEFTIQTSLAIARDRVFGVLLGLFSMWLLFDRLWGRNALDEMRDAFIKNLEMSAEFAEQFLQRDITKSILTARQLRDRINAGFATVTAQADAIVFEFGPDRDKKLRIRDDFRRWQSSIRTLLQLQITLSQYRVTKSLRQIPTEVARTGILFEKNIFIALRAMSNSILDKVPMPVPDLQTSAASFEQAIRKYHQDLGIPLSPEASDIIVLIENIVSVVVPLYNDVRSVCALNGEQFVLPSGTARLLDQE